jgi:hypothetical protein
LTLHDAVRVTVMADNNANASQGAVRLFDGAVNLTNTDLSNNAQGSSFGVTRTFTNEVGFALDPGNGWEVNDLPHLIQATSAIIVVEGGSAEYFDSTGSAYKPRFADRSTLTADGANFLLTDDQGGQTLFDGFAHPPPPLLRHSQNPGVALR